MGTKLWPESREVRPKHFLPLLPGGKSLFEDNLEFLTKNYPGQVWIQSNEKQLPWIQKLAPNFPGDRIILENSVKNQGAATALFCHRMKERFGGEEIYFTVQADLYREDKGAFRRYIAVSEQLVRERGKLVTGGVKMAGVTAGVDYMVCKRAEEVIDSLHVYAMEEWLGRDMSVDITTYARERQVFLHWNHNCWTVGAFLEAASGVHPEWVDFERVTAHYETIPAGPVEDVTKHALSEGYVIELPFVCWDFGTWKSIAEFGRAHAENQILTSNGNLVRVNHKDVEIIGLTNLVVVETEDALLVVPLDQAGRVGEVVKRLKEEGKSELL